jgi:hypothetical protein
MNVLFFLIRLPFFVIAICILIAIPIVVLTFGLGFAFFVLPLGVAVWLLVVVLVFIYAAFANRADVLTSFFRETWKWINDLFEQYVVGAVRDYLKLYAELFKWLIGKGEQAT